MAQAWTRIGRRPAAALLTVLVWAASPCAAAPTPLPFDRPSVPTPRAATADVTAVTHAGARLVAAGERGVVLLSDDDGGHWRQARAVPVSVTLTGLRFVSASEGWAIGHAGVVLHTVDGGESWVRQLDGVTAARLTVAEAEAAPPGPGRDRMLRDAHRLVAEGPDKPFLDLLVTDAGAGQPHQLLAVGAYGLAMRSGDGGQTWQSAMAQFEDPRGLHIYHLACTPGRCFAAGEQGLFLTSENGGRYLPRKIPYAGTMFGVLATGGQVFAYGLRGTLLRSADAGQSWTAIPTGLDAALACSAVLSDGGIVLGALNGTLLESHDGGASFQRLPEQAPFPISSLVEVPGGLVLAGSHGPVPWHIHGQGKNS